MPAKQNKYSHKYYNERRQKFTLPEYARAHGLSLSIASFIIRGC
jgi:hypothetical protein